jgi:hypothetical protein
MRRLATLVIAATMLPVFGASPEMPGFSTELPSDLDLSLPGFSEKKLKPATTRRTVVLDSRSRPSTCYYIRQLNKDLQKPKDKAELVPLADDSVQPQSDSRMDCLKRSLEPR